MKRLTAAALLVSALGVTGAQAGNVCVNNQCQFVPGVYGSITISLTGQIKVMGGFSGGPGVGTTGFSSVEVKPDNIAVYPLVNGQAWGRYGASIDYGQEAIRVYLGAQGCRQIELGTVIGPCYTDPDPSPSAASR